MHIPSLENVYQTMERQQQILMTEKLKINNIKSRIGMYERGDTPSKIKYSFDKPEKLYVLLRVPFLLSPNFLIQMVFAFAGKHRSSIQCFR